MSLETTTNKIASILWAVVLAVSGVLWSSATGCGSPCQEGVRQGKFAK